MSTENNEIDINELSIDQLMAKRKELLKAGTTIQSAAHSRTEKESNETEENKNTVEGLNTNHTTQEQCLDVQPAEKSVEFISERDELVEVNDLKDFFDSHKTSNLAEKALRFKALKKISSKYSSEKASQMIAKEEKDIVSLHKDYLASAGKSTFSLGLKCFVQGIFALTFIIVGIILLFGGLIPATIVLGIIGIVLGNKVVDGIEDIQLIKEERKKLKDFDRVATIKGEKLVFK